LFAASIDFQIAQDQRPLAAALEKNERIRRPKLRGVKHVWVGLACSDDKARSNTFFFAHGGLYFPQQRRWSNLSLTPCFSWLRGAN